MKIIVPFLIFMNSFLSCQGKPATGEDSFLPEKNLLNISYGKDSLHRMDIYLPAGRSAKETRSLVLIHGGSWISGSKSDFAAYIDSFRKRMPEYAIFNINYRLVNGGNLFPAQEEDVRAALEFISSKADEYAIDRKGIVLIGASAGAHLAMLQAYKYREPQISAVVNFFGPSDLLKMYHQPWHPMLPYALQMITGTTPAKNQKLYHESSPVNFITPESAPTLIFHGNRDPVVDISQSETLSGRLKESGVQHELVIYKGARHGWYGSTLSNSFDRIEQFLQNLK